VSRLSFLIALTAGLSLLYGIQCYLDGPVRLAVVSEINDLTLSPDGSLVAAALQDGTVRLWEVPRDENAWDQGDWVMRELSGHTSPVIRVAFDQEDSALFSASRDGTVRVWDVADSGRGDSVLNIPQAESLTDLSVTPDGSTLAVIGEDGVVRVWDVATGQELQAIGPQQHTKRAVALSHDGALVAAGDGENIQIWSASTGESVQRLEGYWKDETTQEEWLGHEKEECFEFRMSFRKSEKVFLINSLPKEILLFELCQPNRVMALAFSPDGETLASGAVDKTSVFWDLESGEVKGIAEGHYGAITKLVFNQQGNAILSSSSDSKAKTWHVPGGKTSATFVGHLNVVNGATYVPDAESILTAGGDGTLRLWDAVSTTELHIEWTVRGLQPVWSKLFNIWMPLSGLLGLVCARGLWQVRRWSHLLALALYILGPIVVLGLPLLETYSYPFSLGTRLEIAWPLLVLGAWYAMLVMVLTRESVAVFYEAPQTATLAEKLMASQQSRRVRQGLFIGAVWVLLLVILYSVLRRFDLDLAFMGHFFSFIMAGIGVTFLVSAVAITLAVVLALLGALGRLSNNPIANGISGFYISLIRGTPLLVQIFFWYLGLPRLNIILPAEWAGILALGVNYGAYMTEVFRAGIQAIGIGQHEAAHALGMTRAQTLRRIVLPQAFRIVIPPIGNQFIAMMKDSSLVYFMGVWELTFRAQKIGRQHFRSLETFMIAAAFYWILTVIFQFLQGKLEAYMARGDRPVSITH
jgi:polar amino acid transport system permease protein